LKLFYDNELEVNIFYISYKVQIGFVSCKI